MKKLFSFIILWILVSCSLQTDRAISLEQALSIAGENRQELEKVLEHYQQDTLKLKAAQYLIQNMPYHFARVDFLLSPDGKPTAPDIKNLKSDYLIRNIDLAFQAWQNPWAKEVSFDDFCRYILPYRAQTEALSDMRQELMDCYLPLIDSGKATTSLEACKIINAQFMRQLEYKATGKPHFSTIEETHQTRRGECEALCNYSMHVMRAVGIPVVIHSTIWTRMDLMHYWGAVLHEGQFHDFSPAYDQPDSYRHKLATIRHLRPAKVYRTLFDPEFKEPEVEEDGFVTNLKSPLLRDITKEYGFPTLEMQIESDKPVSSEKKQIYLCTYNYYKWEPIAIGMRDGVFCKFKDVVGNNIFIVAEAAGKRDLKYITAPFLVDPEGNIRKFIPNTHTPITQILPKSKEEAPRILHFWDTDKDRFQKIACDEVTSDTTQLYTQIPENALLWYTTPHQALGQRVGFIDNGVLKNTIDL